MRSSGKVPLATQPGIAPKCLPFSASQRLGRTRLWTATWEGPGNFCSGNFGSEKPSRRALLCLESRLVVSCVRALLIVRCTRHELRCGCGLVQVSYESLRSMNDVTASVIRPTGLQQALPEFEHLISDFTHAESTACHSVQFISNTTSLPIFHSLACWIQGGIHASDRSDP